MEKNALTSNSWYEIESGKLASIWGSTKPSKLVNLCNRAAHFFSHVQPQSASVGKKGGALPSFSFTQVFLISFVFSHLPFSLKFSIFIFFISLGACHWLPTPMPFHFFSLPPVSFHSFPTSYYLGPLWH
jgi:hypothetical protein